MSLLKLACVDPTSPPVPTPNPHPGAHGGSLTSDEYPAPLEVPTLIAPIAKELPRPTQTLVHKELKPRIREVSQKSIRTTARRPHLPPRREATVIKVSRTGQLIDGNSLDVGEYVFRNPPDPPAEVEEQPADVKMTPQPQALPLLPTQRKTSPGLGTRYKTHDMDLFAPEYKTYAESSGEVRTRMERDAVIANVLRRNQRKICEERGIPPDVFSRIWEEYRESNTYQGKFFHRDEIVRKELKDNTLRMQAALAAYKEHEAQGEVIL